MPNWTQAEYIMHLAKQPSAKPVTAGAVKRETDLHQWIMDYCNGRFPRWKFIRARSDQKSTIAVGAPDFTIFKPNGKTLCVECKKGDGKLSSEQLAWHKEMEMLGHAIHVVRSVEDFLRIIVLDEAL